ncbi:c-type cytochrome [Vibrio fluminensis]|uniref:c-type cytochrome n=1 Tax=Vibrio fluminensis TaxID=2783614 RepID=UPI001886CE72|nr:cytochrome c [Vibrio fluminensis]
MQKIATVLIAATLIILPSLVLANTITPSAIENGQQHYRTLCLACHGEMGHGDGIAAQALNEQPSNIYQELNSWFESEAELIETVLNGNEEMPAWGSVLNQQQVREIFAYIEHINQEK